MYTSVLNCAVNYRNKEMFDSKYCDNMIIMLLLWLLYKIIYTTKVLYFYSSKRNQIFLGIRNLF